MKISTEWSDALLNLVKSLNNFNYREACTTHNCVPLYVGNMMVGVILPDVLNKLLTYPDIFTLDGHRTNKEGKALVLSDKLQTVEERDKALGAMIDDLRAKDAFVSLRGWRNEKFSIYYKRDQPPLFNIERSACPLIGPRQYGVHVNGYTFKDGELLMWVGQRSQTKPTYPGMLDNMCAGGLAAGLGVRECLIKECREEASVDDASLEKLKSAGTLSYCFRDHRGILAETQYIFDLELSPDFVPCNADGEVAGFQLCTVEELQDLIIARKFKPNCALVIVNFLIRHGILIPDNEPHYVYLMEMMHVSLQPPL